MTALPIGAGLHLDRWSRMVAPLLGGVGVCAAVVGLHLRDPHVAGSYGVCPLLLLTGWYCPGCGGLRALNDLTHGDVVAALSSNLVAVAVLAPVAVLVWFSWARSRWRGWVLSSPLLTAPVAWSTLALLLVFGLARNLGVGSWLAP
ncbi:MAG TPA: DUF2752 domain-containing protein [Nocardioidaceae bacterium]|nr:DUF2752 domain-containing protein [Nocardioidaceae bacterium]